MWSRKRISGLINDYAIIVCFLISISKIYEILNNHLARGIDTPEPMTIPTVIKMPTKIPTASLYSFGAFDGDFIARSDKQYPFVKENRAKLSRGAQLFPVPTKKLGPH